MSQALSVYLNCLRFGAALLVLLSHFAYPRFTDGTWLWVRHMNLGSDAVVLFFVLSGFVIALTTQAKDRSMGQYAFNRATRIYSVAIPALIIGFLLDRLGAHVAPEFYFQPYYNPLPFWETMLRGLTFSTEWAGSVARLGTNGPYWSLSYEVAYYALFAVAFYLRGAARIVLVMAGIVLFGLNVLLLIPAWLMGVALYHRLRRGDLPSGARAAGLALLPLCLYGLAQSFDVQTLLARDWQVYFDGHGLRYSDEYLWNALVGAMVTMHLFGMAGLVKDRDWSRLSAKAAWAAGASFSLYLVHYPILQAIHALMPNINDALLFALVILMCLLFADAFERPLPRYRRMTAALIDRARQAGAVLRGGPSRSWRRAGRKPGPKAQV